MTAEENKNSQNSVPAADLIRDVLELNERGFAVTDLPARAKHSARTDYLNEVLTEADIRDRFRSPDTNVGILLGEASGKLADLDFDWGTARLLARAVLPSGRLLPETSMWCGRESAPHSHGFVRLDQLPDGGKDFADPEAEGDAMIVQMRVNGHVVAPPSVYPPDSEHPVSERSIWGQPGEPSHHKLQPVERGLREIAAACLLASRMPPAGGARRREFSLALAGLLLRHLSVEATTRVVHATWYAAGVRPENGYSGLNHNIRTTAKKLEKGGAATGGPVLETFVGEKVVAKVREWLGIGTGTLQRTDYGNAERLVRRHGNKIRHVHGIGWFCWTGHRWERDETGQISRFAKETARSIYREATRVDDDQLRKELAKHGVRSESASRLAAMVSLAQSEPGVPLKAEDLDPDPWLLNVENGTVDLRTGAFLPHRREDLITKIAPVMFDPDAKCPLWEAFLERAIPNPTTRQYLKRLVGFSLTGKTNEKVLPCLLGPGDTGKSTFIETVLALMGDGYAKAAPEELILAKRGTAHPTELAFLLGLRFAPTVEIPEGRHLAESRVKQLTGGDKITARRMNEDFFDFKPTHKLWLAANHPPQIKTGDSAIWNRIKKIPFDVVIPPEERDTDLKEKLRGELGGVLNWAIEGCLEWQREGLGEPEEVRTATAEYQQEQDEFGEFLAGSCVLGPNERVTSADLKQTYRNWCLRNNQDELKWKIVLERLRGRGCTTGKKVRDKGGTSREGLWGIGLQEVEFDAGGGGGGDQDYFQKLGKSR